MNSTISSFQSQNEWRKGNERTVLLLSNLGQAKLFFLEIQLLSILKILYKSVSYSFISASYV